MKRHDAIELESSALLHKGRVFDLRHERLRLPSGREQALDVIDHPGAVAVVAPLAGGELLLVRQYRHATGEWLIEIPAGRLERGDADPLAAARRELEEETGHTSDDWSVLSEFYPAPGFCSERMTLFLARGARPVPGGGLACDPDEELEVVRLTPAELLAGGCVDAKTLLAAALLARERSA